MKIDYSQVVVNHAPSSDPGVEAAPQDRAYYPVMLDLSGRTTVVIGGGAIAAQKTRELLDAGAFVRVVSPSLVTTLADMERGGRITVEQRGYRYGDLAGAAVAIAATDDRAVNHRVWKEACDRNVLLNAVDDVRHCHFIAPSVHREGGITVTVSTAGQCPALAVRLRERLSNLVRWEHAELARVAAGLRDEITHRVPDFAARRHLWYSIVDSGAIDAIRSRDSMKAREIIEQLVSDAEQRLRVDAGASPSEPFVVSRASPRAGRVFLIGAGPGDPGLITVRGLNLLRTADIVVYDRLVGRELLTYPRRTARLIPVGKHGHGSSTPQDEINELLVREARAGNVVVRLKGGDPFVFGRGAEECAALRNAGIRFEVIPGITSAIAVPAAAGIPLTDRSIASGFAVVTGHLCRDGSTAGDNSGNEGKGILHWDALAKMPTLVVLMGLRALPEIVSRLIANGRSGDTPAAVISRGTLPDQQVVSGTLSSIVADVGNAHIEQPATLIVGDVVKLADVLESQEHQRSVCADAHEVLV